MAFAQWLYAPTGRKGIAQGKAKRRPGIRYATIFASPERAEPAVRQSMRTCFALSGLWRIGAAAYPGRSRTTQGGASLYPGLSHYAPLGRTIRLRIGVQKTRGQSPCFLGVYPARAQTQLPGGLGQVPRRWLRVKRNSRRLGPKRLTGFVAGAPAGGRLDLASKKYSLAVG